MLLDRSLWSCLIAGIAGSNLSEGMDVCLLLLLSIVQTRPLRRTGHSFIADLPGVCVFAS